MTDKSLKHILHVHGDKSHWLSQQAAYLFERLLLMRNSRMLYASKTRDYFFFLQTTALKKKEEKNSTIAEIHFSSPGTNTFKFCHILLDQNIQPLNLQMSVDISSERTCSNGLSVYILIYRGGHKLYGHMCSTEQKKCRVDDMVLYSQCPMLCIFTSY